MSVNEVKLKRTVLEFDVRGTGDAGSRTFAIGNEDHTLGNALRHVLMQNQAVEFAGYSVPHPSEPIMQIRVQTVEPSNNQDEPRKTAMEVLKQSCHTLSDICDILLQQVEQLLPEVKEDRKKLELHLMEYQDDYMDEDGGDDQDMEEGDGDEVVEEEEYGEEY